MSKLKKIIFWVVIIPLALWILQPIVFGAIELEFNNDDFEILFENIRYRGVPICVFLLFFASFNFKESDDGGKFLLKIITTLGATIFSHVFMVMIIFTGFCDWTNKELLYTNKKDESVQIISRTYGCGVFDDMEPPLEKNFKMQREGEYFIWAKEINIDEIDKMKWK